MEITGMPRISSSSPGRVRQETVRWGALWPRAGGARILARSAVAGGPILIFKGVPNPS
jgi:hypothetical protein